MKIAAFTVGEHGDRRYLEQQDGRFASGTPVWFDSVIELFNAARERDGAFDPGDFRADGINLVLGVEQVVVLEQLVVSVGKVVA